MKIEQFEVAGLAQYSYIVSDGGEAVGIDPERDVERYIAYAQREGVDDQDGGRDPYPRRLRVGFCGTGSEDRRNAGVEWLRCWRALRVRDAASCIAGVRRDSCGHVRAPRDAHTGAHARASVVPAICEGR